MATYRLDGFADVPHTLEVERAGYEPSTGRARWRYRLAAGDEVIFAGDDLGSPPEATEDEVAKSALGFLTLRPGDTDADYFDAYTPGQLAWCEAHAEDLSMALLGQDGAEIRDLAAYRVQPSERGGPSGHTSRYPVSLESPVTDAQFLGSCAALGGTLRALAAQVSEWAGGIGGLNLPPSVLGPLHAIGDRIGQAAASAEQAAQALEAELGGARDTAARGMRITGGDTT